MKYIILFCLLGLSLFSVGKELKGSVFTVTYDENVFKFSHFSGKITIVENGVEKKEEEDCFLFYNKADGKMSSASIDEWGLFNASRKSDLKEDFQESVQFNLDEESLFQQKGKIKKGKAKKVKIGLFEGFVYEAENRLLDKTKQHMLWYAIYLKKNPKKVWSMSCTGNREEIAAFKKMIKTIKKN